MPALEFWYEFASTYSYPAAMRVEAVAAARDVAVRWRPFLLGPIFAAQGLTTSPFNVNAAKGAHMWRDLHRICAKHGLPFVRPDPFPQNSLLATRVAVVLDEAHRPAFSRAIYRREFGEGQPIGSPDTIAEALAECGLDATALMAEATGDANKAKLKGQAAQVEDLGLFGAPSFVTADRELFWGNDRLEDAVEWAARRC